MRLKNCRYLVCQGTLRESAFFEIAMIFWPRKEFITVHKKNYDSQ